MSKQVQTDRYSLLTIINDMIVEGYLRQEPGKRTTEEVIKRTMQLTKPKLSELVNVDDARDDAEVSVESPFEVVKLVNAVNGIGTNLGIVFGKIEVRMMLQEALAKSTKQFPNLAGIKVYPDSPALDMRGASAEFSNSQRTVPALLHLSVTLVDLAAQMARKFQE